MRRWISTLAGALVAAAPACADVSVQAYGPGQYFDELRYWVSSVLPSQGANSYGPANLFDGSDRTAWCEGVPGTGSGESITISFGGEAMPLRLMVRNGYAKSADIHAKNARPRNVRVSTSTGNWYVTELADTMGWQELPLVAEWISWVEVSIRDVYPGTKYTDTCISALEVDFEGG